MLPGFVNPLAAVAGSPVEFIGAVTTLSNIVPAEAQAGDLIITISGQNGTNIDFGRANINGDLITRIKSYSGGGVSHIGARFLTETDLGGTFGNSGTDPSACGLIFRLLKHTVYTPVEVLNTYLASTTSVQHSIGFAGGHTIAVDAVWGVHGSNIGAAGVSNDAFAYDAYADTTPVNLDTGCAIGVKFLKPGESYSPTVTGTATNPSNLRLWAYEFDLS